VVAVQSIILTLSNVAAADDVGGPLASCDPTSPPPTDPTGIVVGPCFPATLNFVIPPTATATNTALPATATNTPIPPTNTPIPPTATNTATPTATPSGINQTKSCVTHDGRYNTYEDTTHEGDPDATGGNDVAAGNANAAGNECNLFICLPDSPPYQREGTNDCSNEGEGDLVVLEQVTGVGNSAVSGDPSVGLGAYEFEVEFDSLVIQSVNPADVVFALADTTDPTDNPAGAGVAREPAKICSLTIFFENSVRFGCITKGITPDGPLGAFDLAKLDLVPAADDLKDLFPGNNNGIPTLIKDNQCELANTLGHPFAGSVNNAGQNLTCDDIYVTVRILEGDINLDCNVNLDDETIIALHYGSSFGSAFYQKWYDLEPSFHDLDIDIKDLQKVFGRDGSSCDNPIPQQTPVAAPFSLGG
jgi:hypothetical protein